jgi:hypothetical protein
MHTCFDPYLIYGVYEEDDDRVLDEGDWQKEKYWFDEDGNRVVHKVGKNRMGKKEGGDDKMRARARMYAKR